MKRAQYFNQQKKGGGHSLIISEKKRTTYTAVGCFKYDYDALGHRSLFFFFFLVFSFFLDWHSDQLIMGHLNPVGPSGVGGLLIVTAIQGERFDVLCFFRFATFFSFLLRILHFLCVFSFFPSSLFLYKHIQRYANGRGGEGAYLCEGGREGGRPFFFGFCLYLFF